MNRPADQTELAVRRALARAAVDVSPGDWSAEELATRVEGLRRRRRRRTGVLVPALVAVLTAGMLISVGAFRPSDRAPGAPRLAAGAPTGAAAAPPGRRSAVAQRTAPASTAHGAAMPSAAATVGRPTVTVVRAGQPLTIGHGWKLTLTHDERCLRDVAVHGKETCRSLAKASSHWADASVQVRAKASKLLLVSPTFRGDSSRIGAAVLTLGGSAYPMRVVRLPGHPDYAVLYQWLPLADLRIAGGKLAPATTTVYDLRGRLLAKVPTPKNSAASPSSVPTTVDQGG